MSEALSSPAETLPLFPEPSATERLPAPSPTEAGAEQFDWFTAKEVIIERQQSIAVYRNGRDHIVIRAENEFDADADPFIVVSTARALERLVDALIRERKKGFIAA